jgi:hypothetical protein
MPTQTSHLFWTKLLQSPPTRLAKMAVMPASIDDRASRSCCDPYPASVIGRSCQLLVDVEGTDAAEIDIALLAFVTIGEDDFNVEDAFGKPGEVEPMRSTRRDCLSSS